MNMNCVKVQALNFLSNMKGVKDFHFNTEKQYGEFLYEDGKSIRKCEVFVPFVMDGLLIHGEDEFTKLLLKDDLWDWTKEVIKVK